MKFLSLIGNVITGMFKRSEKRPDCHKIMRRRIRAAGRSSTHIPVRYLISSPELFGRSHKVSYKNKLRHA